MPVDSFKFLPGSIAGYYRNMPIPREEPVPWTPLAKPIAACRFSLVTTAGIYVRGLEEPFDVEREKREPMWGDPTYRVIPPDVQQDQVGASHLHINNRDLLADVNVVLPVHRFREMEEAGAIGSLATSYSFMGYQTNNAEWRNRYGPEVARRMQDEGVDAALVTPA
jgi:D-proline reductase (dithiol) PrdB